MKRLGILIGVCLVVESAFGQRTLLGKHPDDKFLPAFWSQNLNASNLVAGLNANSPLTLTNLLLPGTILSKTLSGINLTGANVLSNAATLTILTNARIKLASGARLVFTNGAAVTDDTGGRSWNFKLTVDSESVARYTDVSNIVDNISLGAGTWVALDDLEPTQFLTNSQWIRVQSGAPITNLYARARLHIDGGLAVMAAAKATNYTVGFADDVILADAASSNLTFTLPAVSTTNLVFRFVKTDSGGNTVTIDAHSSELINGALTRVLTNQYDTVTVMSYQTEWFILGR